MWKRKAVAALVLAGGMALAIPTGAQAAYAYDHPFERTDPAETGCNVGAYVVKAWDMRNAVHNEVQGLAQLVYSPKCGTNWVNVYGFTTGYFYQVTIQGHQQGNGLYGTGVDPGDSAATLQTYTPGDTCVTVGWSITNVTSQIREGWASTTIC